MGLTIILGVLVVGIGLGILGLVLEGVAKLLDPEGYEAWCNRHDPYYVPKKALEQQLIIKENANPKKPYL